MEKLISDIFSIKSSNDFNEVALNLFQLQYNKVSVYRAYCELLNVKPTDVRHIDQIPFLPIQFFKSKKICWDENYEKEHTLFLSSGTMAQGRSHHYVYDSNVYKQSFIRAFEKFYGAPEEWTIIALLPSYEEQGNSSLIYMVDHLIKTSRSELSGFYRDHETISELLSQLNHQGRQVILFGVSYALLDLVEFAQFNLPDLVVMETGGMKGRRKEMTKEELHYNLKKGFGVSGIHSEYGMTELLSQGYSTGDEWFDFPLWIRPVLRSTNDPLALLQEGHKTGGVNMIDLANIYSCSFIATQDLGRMEDGRLKIMGRFDHSDTRGCNLLVDH